MAMNRILEKRQQRMGISTGLYVSTLKFSGSSRRTLRTGVACRISMVASFQTANSSLYSYGSIGR